MQKLCIECGIPYKGRSDKKFCSDYCRNHYNNKRNSFTNNYMRRINSILRKNRKILSEMYPGGQVTISRSQLLWEGFDFRYSTHTTRSVDGKVCYFCYDFGYMHLNQRSCKVITADAISD